MNTTLSTEPMIEGLAKILEHKRNQAKLEGWFLFQELKMDECASLQQAGKDPEAPENQADILIECVKKMRLSIPPGSVIAGTQDDAFSPSYALINPEFKVETFAGYCDPLAVYNDIKPNPETGITAERIEKTRSYWAESGYVKELSDVYKRTGVETQEVIYFVEPVTGHTIPDMRPALKHGIRNITANAPNTGPYSGQMKKAFAKHHGRRNGQQRQRPYQPDDIYRS